MIAIDLSKQQALDVDLKAIQQFNYTGNLNRAADATFFIIEEAKETTLNFSQGTVKYYNFIFCLNIKWLDIVEMVEFAT